MENNIQLKRSDNFTKLDVESSKLAKSLYETQLLEQVQEQETCSSQASCSSTKSSTFSDRSFSESPAPIGTEEADHITVTRRNANPNFSPKASPVSSSDKLDSSLHRSFSARVMSLASGALLPRSQSAKL